MGRDADFLDAKALYPSPEVVAVDAVPIPEEVLRRSVPRERLDDLVRGPFGGRVRGHVEVDDLPPVVQEHDEDIQDPERRRRHREEIAGSDLADVVSQELPPALRWRLSFPRDLEVLGDGGWRDLVAQDLKFGMDPRCAPGRVLDGHPADEVADLALDGRAAGSGLRLPASGAASPHGASG